MGHRLLTYLKAQKLDRDTYKYVRHRFKSSQDRKRQLYAMHAFLKYLEGWKAVWINSRLFSTELASITVHLKDGALSLGYGLEGEINVDMLPSKSVDRAKILSDVRKMCDLMELQWDGRTEAEKRRERRAERPERDQREREYREGGEVGVKRGWIDE